MSGKKPSHTKNWREELKKRGLEKVEIYVPHGMKPLVKQIEIGLRNRAHISITPAETSGSMETNYMKDSIGTPWTIDTLEAALRDTSIVGDGEMDVEIVEGAERTLVVSMIEYGNLEIHVSVVGEQILCSTLLWPLAEQPNAAAFNEMALRSHKMMPLSAFGITTIDGSDWYELFGALSARAILQSVVTELRTLAQNAIDLALEREEAEAA